MIRFAAFEFARFAATTLVAATAIDLLLRLAPSDSATQGPFLGWIGGMVTRDLGRAAGSGTSVGGAIAAALAVSLPLLLLAAILTAAIGIGLGALAARRPDNLLDRALQGLSEIGVATPNFWLGMLLAVLFSTILKWLPAAGFLPWTVNPLAAFNALVLPALALAIPQGLAMARMVRRELVDAVSAPYFLAAEARGLTRREALRRHAIPNARAAIVAGLEKLVVALIGGAMVVETVFYLPGLGRMILEAIAARDLDALRPSLLTLALLLTGTTLLSRLGLGLVDPRLVEARPA